MPVRHNRCPGVGARLKGSRVVNAACCPPDARDRVDLLARLPRQAFQVVWHGGRVDALPQAVLRGRQCAAVGAAMRESGGCREAGADAWPGAAHNCCCTLDCTLRSQPFVGQPARTSPVRDRTASCRVAFAMAGGSPPISSPHACTRRAREACVAFGATASKGLSRAGGQAAGATPLAGTLLWPALRPAMRKERARPGAVQVPAGRPCPSPPCRTQWPGRLHQRRRACTRCRCGEGVGVGGGGGGGKGLTVQDCTRPEASPEATATWLRQRASCSTQQPSPPPHFLMQGSMDTPRKLRPPEQKNLQGWGRQGPSSAAAQLPSRGDGGAATLSTDRGLSTGRAGSGGPPTTGWRQGRWAPCAGARSPRPAHGARGGCSRAGRAVGTPTSKRARGSLASPAARIGISAPSDGTSTR